MNKKDRLKLVSTADEGFIEEANPKNKRFDTKRIIAGVLVACFALLFISTNLYLFLPIQPEMPQIAQYKGDKYYPVIEKLSTLYYKEPSYKNNFDRITSSLFSVKGDAAPGDSWDGDYGTLMPPDGSAKPGVDDGSESNGGYVEVTDNQTAGVTEADKIKRTDKYIFYLHDYIFRIYSIDKENSECVGSILLDRNTIDYHSANFYEGEFYLSDDGNTVTVFAPGYDKDIESYVLVISLDVSKPQDIKVKSTVKVEGNYVSTRKTENGIILVSNYYLSTSLVDFGKPETFVPKVDTGDGFEPIEPENIYIPDKIYNTRYVVITKIDENGLTLDRENSLAVLSYSNEFYMSRDNIYLFNNRSERADSYVENVSDIVMISYNGGKFENKGTFTVDGHILNRFSLDEKDGILRAVTTTECIGSVIGGGYDSYDIDMQIKPNINRGENASLYCIDISDFSLIACVENFAPYGESVQSVRFDGNYAYVCTAEVITVTDPVFFFDLSDLSNITYKDTGNIEGYSSSLINLGEGFLLGVGVGADGSSLKLEVYEEGSDGIVSVDALEYKNWFASADYKSYYIDRENNIIGLGVSPQWSSVNSEKYIVLHFNGYKINEIAYAELQSNPSHMRGVLIDGWFYMFGGRDFKVTELF